MRRALLLVLIGGCTGLYDYNAHIDKSDDFIDVNESDGDDDDNDDVSTPDDTTTPSTNTTDTGTADTDTTTTDTTTTDTTTTDTTETTGTDTTGTITDTGTIVPPPPPPLDLVSLSPNFGSNSGGTVVTLLGQFGTGTEVRFGSAIATVISETATEMVVEAPAVAGTGWVDVGVTLGAQTDLVSSGFQYWTDGTGQSGSFGFLSYVEFVGGYWASTTPVAYGLMTFTEPGAWEMWQDYTPTLDTCVLDYVPAALPASYAPGAAYMDLDNSGSVTRLLDASVDFGPGFYGDDVLVPNTDVVPGASYDLLTMVGNPSWPAFEVPGMVEIPSPFEVTTPNLDRTNAPNVDSQIELAWTGGGGDYMLVYILRQFWSGSAWLDDGVVTCAVVDDGSFTVPSSVWPIWYEGDFLHIEMARVLQSTAILPHNNADNRTVGLYWYYGGADTIF